MKTYLVGGAVRDMILGVESKDRDYVVVGSNEEGMLALGYSKVGSSFPVFLHPDTREQYALARTHITNPTYVPTIEEDLSLRDLTMNSIAYDEENKQYIDPYNGISDIKNRIIKHTSNAFSDDPLRILRIARFVAKYGFLVHPDTIELCNDLISSGALETIPYNRIWLELSKIFDEDNPSVAIKFLMDIEIWKSERISTYVGYPISIQFESQLSRIQKMYYFLNIGSMDLNDALEFKVPMYIWKEIKFYQALIDFTIENTLTNESIVEFISMNKQSFEFSLDYEFIEMMKVVKAGAFKSGDLIDVSIDKTINVTNLITKCFIHISSLDYSCLESVPKEDIKDIVNKMKLETVNRVLVENSIREL